MKKRLLSAALALAMVLTLLPFGAMPASATTWITAPTMPAGFTGTVAKLNKTDHNGLISVQWKNVGDQLGTMKNGTSFTAASEGYYYYDATNEKLYYAIDGVLGSTTSASGGTWYADPYLNGSMMTSFTLIADYTNFTTGASTGYPQGSLSVNLNNCALTMSSMNDTADTTKLSSLTVTNVPANGAANADKNKGTVALPSAWSNLSDRSITLTVSNATLTGAIKVAQGGDTTSYGITATQVNNAKLPDLTVEKGSLQLSLTNGSEVGAVTQTSTKSVTSNISLADSTAASINVSIPTGGIINVGTSASTRGTVNGPVVLTNTSATSGGGTVNAWNATINGQVELNGIGTKLVANNSNITNAIALTGNGNFTNAPTLSQAQLDSSALPSVEIHGGRVGNYDGTNPAIRVGWGENLTGKYNITIDGNATVGDINLGNATINVTYANAGKITLPAGSLTVTGTDSAQKDQYASLGDLTLGGANTKVEFRVKGQRVSVGSITLANSGTGVVEAYTPYEDTNVLGPISGGAGKFSNRGLEGGTFRKATTADATNPTAGLPHEDNLVIDLRYIAQNNSSEVSYYKGTDLQKLVDYYQKYAGTDGSGAWIHPVGQNGGGTGKTVGIYDGDTRLTVITYYQTPTNIFLPTSLNGKANITKYTETIFSTAPTWSANTAPTGGTKGKDVTAGTNYGTPIDANGTAVPCNDVLLNLQESDSNITKLTDVVSTMDGVTARLDGNTISLSGTVMPTSGTSTINIKISTDGKPGLKDKLISLVFDPNANPNLTFANMTSIGEGLHISSDRTRLYMPDDSTYYTLKSSLKTQAEKLPADQVIGYTQSDLDVQVKVTKSGSGWTTVRQQDVGKALTTNSTVSYVNSPAVKEALNAVVATITDSQIDSWVRQAQDAAWRASGHTTAMTDGQRATSGYHKVYVEAFLDVTISDFNSASTPGTFTATMVPSYRIYVKDESSTLTVPANTQNFIYIHTGREDYQVRSASLGSLSGEAGQIVVSLDLAAYNAMDSEKNFTLGTGDNKAQAHQGGTYVYDASQATGKVQFTLTHLVNNGLGTIVVNGEQPMVTLVNYKLNPTTGEATADVESTQYYDTLQAAVDDSTNGANITVQPAYQSSVDIKVTGTARKFTVNSLGNRTVTSSSTNVIVDGTAGGNKYVVQLTRDNVTKPTGNVTITVAAAANGRAVVSASTAKAGDTITVTCTPNTGYAAGGLTIRTDAGATVSYTSAGTNVYRFTVPENVKSITVTPAFVQSNTGATVTVSNTSEGTAVTSAGANKVAAGTPVTVTTTPSTGRRTMGLYVTSNVGATTATRTGVNSFVFNVPAGATNVVVTPRFDTNNGTVFEDVWSTEYYSAPVAWAVTRGITDGTSTYTFSPGSTCNRVQMVTFLWRAAGRPSTAGMVNPFYDVSPSMGSDFYNAILWANNKGITQGDGGANRFNPYGTITRAQAVTFLWRYAGKPAAASNSGFYDVPANEYYAQAVTWAVGKGITNGDGSAVRFNPNGACLRAQIVTFLYRQSTGVRA